MRSTPKLLLIFFALMLVPLLIPLVSAQENFSAGAERSYSLCPCSGQGYYITITNTGTVQSAYTLSANKEVASWVTFSPKTLSLAPRTAAKIAVYVNSPCNLRQTIPFTIAISASNRLTKAISQQITFVPCYGFTIIPGKAATLPASQKTMTVDPYNGTYAVCNSAKTAIPLLISNTDLVFDNVYSLKTDSADASFSVSSFALKKGASGVIFLTYSPQTVGKHIISLDALSAKGEVAQRKSLLFDVKECYGLSLEFANDQVEQCGGMRERHKFRVENGGIFPENITLRADGPEWISTDQASFVLNPSQSLEGAIAINPPAEAEGTFKVVANVSLSSNQAISSTDVLTLTMIPLKKCYNAEIEIKERVSVTGEGYIPIRITNAGEKQAVFSLSLSGIEWASIDAKEASLNPKESLHANIHLLPSANASKGSYPLTLTVSTGNATTTKQISLIYTGENQTLLALQSFFGQYRYYLYALAILLIILFIFRNRIMAAYREQSKQRALRKARLNALRKAREERKKKTMPEAKAEKRMEMKAKEPQQISLFSLASSFLIFLAVILGLMISLYPTATMQFFSRYWGLAVIVFFLIASAVYFFWPKKKKK